MTKTLGYTGVQWRSILGWKDHPKLKKKKIDRQMPIGKKKKIKAPF